MRPERAVIHCLHLRTLAIGTTPSHIELVSGECRVGVGVGSSLSVFGSCSFGCLRFLIPQQAKEGIKRKIAKGPDQSEVFDAVVSVQRQLIHFHERKEGIQLLMDRSLAVLAHLRKEDIQVYCCQA